MITRRRCLQLAAALSARALLASPAADSPIELPADHLEMIRRRKRRIVVQHDAHDVLRSYSKLHPDEDAPFERFNSAVFSYVDEAGSQIDAIWWDSAGATVGAVYPSDVLPAIELPLLKVWLSQGIDWVRKLVDETRRRKLEVFWNHRISEVDGLVEGGLDMKHLHPLKAAHPDWVVPASWWWQGMWNLASEGLREHKVAILRELATRYDLDGIQIDFSRHMPCLPVGHQWELRDHVTTFLRSVRQMLLEVAEKRGRSFLLAAKVPRNLEGCHVDGFDVRVWAEQRLVDVLTLGSRSTDVDVEGYRQAVGPAIQLQPCFDDHHATDGYRHQSIEFFRGVFANHFQRGANSVVTFNWSIGAPEVCREMGSESGPQSQQLAYQEVGDPRTLAGKDKIFTVERRGGYPWSDGFFNRNDTAPLPMKFSEAGGMASLVLHISDSPEAPESQHARLTLRCVLFGAEDADTFSLRVNGGAVEIITRDPAWKDAQIFSPAPQPTSGGRGDYKINPRQRLLRLEASIPRTLWRQGQNQVEIHHSGSAAAPETAASPLQIEKLEGQLRYA